MLVRVGGATKDLDYILEQPCRTYEECQQVRRVAHQPMKLDELSPALPLPSALFRTEAARDVLSENFQLGGLTKARRVRDYLVENRIPVISEDSWGGEIASAAVAHFAASTPKII